MTLAMCGNTVVIARDPLLIDPMTLAMHRDAVVIDAVTLAM
ncbi:MULTISPECIES: hypothetical protein [Cyanophyceae]|nr:hypothetical protein [Phormidium sp. FACHB-592]